MRNCQKMIVAFLVLTLLLICTLPLLCGCTANKHKKAGAEADATIDSVYNPPANPPENPVSPTSGDHTMFPGVTMTQVLVNGTPCDWTYELSKTPTGEFLKIKVTLPAPAITATSKPLPPPPPPQPTLTLSDVLAIVFWAIFASSLVSAALFILCVFASHGKLGTRLDNSFDDADTHAPSWWQAWVKEFPWPTKQNEPAPVNKAL